MADAGVDPDLPGDGPIDALRRAIADRRGYIDGPIVGDDGFTVELLHPQQMTFDGRTEELALAWCLVYLLGERGEVGAHAFAQYGNRCAALAVGTPVGVGAAVDVDARSHGGSAKGPERCVRNYPVRHN